MGIFSLALGNGARIGVAYVSPLTSADVAYTSGSPTITTSGAYTIYSFTGSGTIVFGRAGLLSRALCVGGGGGGGGDNPNPTAGWESAGGGGAGGQVVPLSDFFVRASTYSVVIGAGGPGNNSTAGDPRTLGNSSCFGNLTNGFVSLGGGTGGFYVFKPMMAANVGGGGGHTFDVGASAPAGVSLYQSGFSGINGSGSGYLGGVKVDLMNDAAGGGAGAGSNGSNTSGSTGGAGGSGFADSITGTSVLYAPGGGGGGITGGAGGSTGGGAGTSTGTGTAGSANTGAGGGGTRGTTTNVPQTGGAGGSGLVIISVLT